MQTASQILADRWQLLEFIGEGAMGEVWRGRHTVLGHDVAIKLMKPEAANDRELAARFRREARIAAQLRHRNLVRVEDFGNTSDGRPFLVMELLRGQSLAALLKHTPRPDPASVARIVQHVGAACDVAHAAGIVHRDLKPDNCFVVSDEDGAMLVKVLDFGVAKVLDGMFMTSSGVVTASHALLGTPMYMSPEQARGQRDLDGRSDLWSLGVIAFEMLTGKLPYSAPTLSQLLYAVLTGPIPAPTSVDPALPPALDAWFTRALHRDRNLRFQTGREVAATLAATLSVQLPIASAPPPPISEESAPRVSPIGSTTPLEAVSLSAPSAPSTPPKPSTSVRPIVGPGSTLAIPAPGSSSQDGKTISDRPPRNSPSAAPPARPGSLPPTQSLAAAYPTSFPAPAPLPQLTATPYANVPVIRTEPIPAPPFAPVFVQPMPAPPPRSNRQLGVGLLIVGVCAGVFVTALLFHARERARSRNAPAPVIGTPIAPPPYYPPPGGFVTIPAAPQSPVQPAPSAHGHPHGVPTAHSHGTAAVARASAVSAPDAATIAPHSDAPLPSNGSGEYDPATP